MTPDDPRHGTDRGHATHMRERSKPCPPCIAAHTRMNTLRELYPERFRRQPALGARRRLQALQAIGYSRDAIANELGYVDGGAIAYLMSNKSKTVTQQLDRRIRELYDRLSMTTPVGPGPTRARSWARRHGFAPPLAWDNIDDPDEIPDGTAEVVLTPSRERTWESPDHRACIRCGVVREVRHGRENLCADCLGINVVAKRRISKAPVECGTERGYQRHRHRGDTATVERRVNCEPCRAAHSAHNSTTARTA